MSAIAEASEVEADRARLVEISEALKSVESEVKRLRRLQQAIERRVQARADVIRDRLAGSRGVMGRILSCVQESSQPVKPAVVALAVGGHNVQSVATMLAKLARDGVIRRAGRGLYTHTPSISPEQVGRNTP